MIAVTDEAVFANDDSHRIEGNLIIGKGSGTGIRIHTGNTGTHNVDYNRVTGFTSNLIVKDSPTVNLRNNIFDNAGTFNIAADVTVTFNGSSNVLEGTKVSNYTPDASDITDSPDLDFDGTPTRGGNCDRSGIAIARTLGFDLFGSPGLPWGQPSRGPIERARYYTGLRKEIIRRHAIAGGM